VRRAFCLIGGLVAGPAVADETALLDFIGGHGCTIGKESRAAAVAAGFEAGQIDRLISGAFVDGTAHQQRAYVVLGEEICTIRLPDIQSDYTVASPEVVAITSAIDAFAADGQPGCYLVIPSETFDMIAGGEVGAGFHDFIVFVGAGIISGDLRFFSLDPLATPVGFQVTTGACAVVPNIDDIRESHPYVANGFGRYIRLLGADTLCDGGAQGNSAPRFAAQVQLEEPHVEPDSARDINAWLFFEYELIAMAAGWHEGMTGTEKGTPRPPLCHYP
jgi:hypothetical protein